MKKILVLPIIVSVIFILSFLPHDAYATTFDIKDQPSCLTLPSGSPSWNATTNTCTVTSISLTLSGDSLTIESGITLVINGGSIDNSGGTITNDGTITIYSGGIIINNSGSFINNNSGGSITNNSGGLSDNPGGISNYGVINNGGIITDNSGGTILNNGGGTINNNSGGTITNNSGGSITNNFTGKIINNSGGAITNNSGGNIYNFGTITNNLGAIINNLGTITNLCGGIIKNSGTISGNPVTNGCHPTATHVTPNPSSVSLSGVITFHVKVRDTSSSPTIPVGIVSWSDGGAGGHFSPISCTLMGGSNTCSLTYTAPSSTGPVTIKATYEGDSTHKTSSGTSALTVS